VVPDILHLVGIEAPADTLVSFDLKETEGETKLVFAQRGWRQQREPTHYCSTK